MNFNAKHAKPVLDLIGKYESHGDYNIVYGGIPAAQRPSGLTSMTVREVLDWQAGVVRKGAASSAAGKYQIIRKTLQSIVSGGQVDTSRKFDVKTQDEMAMYLLRGRGFQRFLDGQISRDDMAIGLAKEWASLPVPIDMQGASRKLKAGQSYYAGDGLNKAYAPVAEVRRALDEAQALYEADAGTPADEPTTGEPGKAAVSNAGIYVIGALLVAVAAFLGFK